MKSLILRLTLSNRGYQGRKDFDVFFDSLQSSFTEKPPRWVLLWNTLPKLGTENGEGFC